MHMINGRQSTSNREIVWMDRFEIPFEKQFKESWKILHEFKIRITCPLFLCMHLAYHLQQAYQLNSLMSTMSGFQTQEDLNAKSVWIFLKRAFSSQTKVSQQQKQDKIGGPKNYGYKVYSPSTEQYHHVIKVQGITLSSDAMRKIKHHT
uniref:Uncharacterized protein n=1 Tax=Romanomermis culicivorax TaxID=13658 RepID=A0A915IIR6_ROMCU